MESLKGVRHLFVMVFVTGLAGFMVIPGITDVTILALCGGRDQCSLAIYLTGLQQAITGVGAVIMTPLVGNLSDKHGRKALLTLPLTLSIIPLVILGYRRTTNFFYAYYLVRTFALVGEACINCLIHAYVADMIPEKKRAFAFGVLAGLGSASFVCGTLAARLLSTALTFQIAALLSMVAAMYTKIFLKESVASGGDLRKPMLKEDDWENGPLQRTMGIMFKRIMPSVKDLICLLKSSPTFTQAAVVLFFNSFAVAGLQASLLYYLKARFQFNKNHFADLLLINGIGATLTQLLFMPILLPLAGEDKLLSVGLFVSSLSIIICSISWSPWVPYIIAVCSVFGVFVRPSVCSIASRQVGLTQQGMVQGSLTGISSFANIISPLVFSPLTALFLSAEAPFYFPGFSIMCIGLALMAAFIQSLTIPVVDPSNSNVAHRISNNICKDALV